MAAASSRSLVWSPSSSVVGDCRHASKISSPRPAPAPPARTGSGGRIQQPVPGCCWSSPIRQRRRRRGWRLLRRASDNQVRLQVTANRTLSILDRRIGSRAAWALSARSGYSDIGITPFKSTRDLGVHDVNERGLWASRSANMYPMASTSTTSTTTPTASLAFRATWEAYEDRRPTCGGNSS